MNRRILLIVALCLISSFVFSQKGSYVPNVVIIKVKAEAEANFKYSYNFNQLRTFFGNFSLLKEFPDAVKPKEKVNSWGQSYADISTIYRISFAQDVDMSKVLTFLKKNKDLEYSEPLYNISLLAMPNDPLSATDQYWIKKGHFDEAWEIHKGDTSTVIGISDTGTSLSHPDLEANIKCNYSDLPDGIDNDGDGYIDNFKGWNFAENNNNAQAPTNGGSSKNHGVYVSGIANAVTDNGIGVSGAAYDCKFVPLRIMTDNGILSNAYQSIVYAANHNLDVVNCSWGSQSYQQMAQDVMNYAAINYDVLIVAAAGNEGVEGNFYPASYENVLSVAGTDSLDAVWSGSSFATTVDVSAPATMFLSTDLEGYTTMWGGTSFASPIVAGASAIARSYYPDLNALQIAELIKYSADNIDTISRVIPDSFPQIDSTWIDTLQSYKYDTTYIDCSYRDYFNRRYSYLIGKGRINLYNALTAVNPQSVTFRNAEFSRENNQITIRGEFTNFLNPVNGLTITFSVDDQYVTVVNPTLNIASMQTLETYMSASDIVLSVANNAPKELSVKLKITYTADGYSAVQLVDVLVNGGYENIKTDKLMLSVAGNGRLGFSDASSMIGRGMVLDDYYDLFADCGIIAGISDNEVYSAVRQISDFKVETFPMKVEEPQLSDSQIYASFNDSADYQAKGVYFEQNVYAWNGVSNANYVIVEYKLVNRGARPINNYYFGLFADWDLYEPSENTASFNPERDFQYCKYEENISLYGGIKLLSNQTINNFVLQNISGGNGYVDISDGFSDVDKYYMISNTYLYTGNKTDVVQTTSAGPITLAPNDTVKVAFALVAANSYYDFINAADSAQAKYLIINPNEIEDNSTEKLSAYPNPASDFIFINSGAEEFELTVYNQLGNQIYKGCNTNAIDITSWTSGTYVLKFENNGVVRFEKIVKL